MLHLAKQLTQRLYFITFFYFWIDPNDHASM